MGRPISKTTKFILALPRNLSAREVLAKATASGLKTSESNVHRVRRLHGGKRAAKVTHAAPAAAGPGNFIPRRGPGRPRKVVLARATSNGSSSARAEDLLRAVAAELGLGPALDILQAERSRVRAMLGA
jgi:hypothetical protein